MVTRRPARQRERIDVHHYIHFDEAQVAWIEALLLSRSQKEDVFMSEVADALADLQAAATEDRDADAAAIGVLQGLAAKVDELVAAQGDTVSAADLTQLATDIRSSSAGLVEAANANTR